MGDKCNDAGKLAPLQIWPHGPAGSPVAVTPAWRSKAGLKLLVRAATLSSAALAAFRFLHHCGTHRWGRRDGHQGLTGMHIDFKKQLAA